MDDRDDDRPLGMAYEAEASDLTYELGSRLERLLSELSLEHARRDGRRRVTPADVTASLGAAVARLRETAGDDALEAAEATNAVGAA